MSAEDRTREAEITSARVELVKAETPEHRRECWQRFRDLINGRSADQVRRMEIQKFGRSFSCE